MESNLWRYLLFVYICNAVGDPIIKKVEGWDPIIKKVEGWNLIIKKVEGWDLIIKKVEGWDLIIKKAEGWDLIIKKVEGWDLIIKKAEGIDLIDRFNPTTLLYLSQAKIWISICICQDIFVFNDIEAKGSCSHCWYWWNCWPALFKLSFHNKYKIHLQLKTISYYLCERHRHIKIYMYFWTSFF